MARRAKRPGSTGGFDVLAIDYAAAAIERARAVLPVHVAQRVLRQADFFEFEVQAFDGIRERDCRRCSPRVVIRAGCFPSTEIPGPRRGPPFVTTGAELGALLGGTFECLQDVAVSPGDSLPVFAGRERWMRWQRR